MTTTTEQDWIKAHHADMRRTLAEIRELADRAEVVLDGPYPVPLEAWRQTRQHMAAVFVNLYETVKRLEQSRQRPATAKKLKVKA